MVKFNDTEYFDDRMFVLYLCKASIDQTKDELITTTLYHDDTPDEHIWAVVTYRNCNRYPLFKVDHFKERDEALKYIEEIEPETPLISRGGKTPEAIMPFDEYQRWKMSCGFKDYYWEELYSVDGNNHREAVFQSVESFKGVN
jgi:hypothetical protein